MEHVDPRAITGFDWPFIASLVNFPTGLWGLVFFNYSFASLMLLAHVIIPSLVATGHIPVSLQRARPVLTVVGALCLVGSACVMVNFINTLPIIYDIFPERLL